MEKEGAVVVKETVEDGVKEVEEKEEVVVEDDEKKEEEEDEEEMDVGVGRGSGWGWGMLGNVAKSTWGTLGEKIHTAEGYLTTVADKIDGLVDEAVDAIERVDTREATAFVSEAGQAGAQKLSHAARGAFKFLTLEGYVESDDDEDGGILTGNRSVSMDTSKLGRVVEDKLRAEQDSGEYDASTESGLIETAFEKHFIVKG